MLPPTGIDQAQYVALKPSELPKLWTKNTQQNVTLIQRLEKNIAGCKNVLKICLENGEGIEISTNKCSCFWQLQKKKKIIHTHLILAYLQSQLSGSKMSLARKGENIV